ncbi:MEDS domain-containing protein [Rubinisphaera margarita]|uniref:MEDS domain-containing protein n=1 Tax=Rubinisphaera margarita TaxID=2909586 RepID=UPI001EE8AC93|nr:MEDS domain-containing protein [Rubinisphaera margarita]MCG6154808.1 MEDS domain-containing protein [Rubinisphaera margarita]
MAHQLAEQIRDLRPSDHVCMIYENAEDQMAAAVPFIQSGLAGNELCLYLADESTCQEVDAALVRGGVDVEREKADGRLAVLTKYDGHLHGGTFDPDAMMQRLETVTRQALDDGFSGLRIIGEMSWALGSELGCDRLIEYEARVNAFFPNQPVIAICLYNRQRFSPSIIRDVLRTHPVAVLGQQVCPNLYYEPPELIRDQASDDFRVEWMIRQLQQARSAEQSLEEINRLLQDTNRRKDEFLAMLGHELRNPLAAISNGIFLLGLGSMGEEETAETHRMITHQLQTVSRLVDDLLDVARVTRGKITLSHKQINIVTAVQNVLHTLKSEIASRNHRLAVAMPSSPVFVSGDATRLEQVISNVVHNAIKYTLPDGQIEISLQPEGDEARLTITDNGVGMPPEFLPAAFELFAQGERTLARSEGGLGIGLTMAKSLIELHGGSISARSAGANEGTSIEIRLPLLHVEEARPLSKSADDDANAAHILLVEDNAAAARTMQLLLERLGQRVTIACNGRTALKLAEDITPDLALLDIGLPDLDGYAVARELRTRYGPEMPIFALSGYAPSEERTTGSGFTGHCIKPLSLANLLSLLKNIPDRTPVAEA